MHKLAGYAAEEEKSVFIVSVVTEKGMVRFICSDVRSFPPLASHTYTGGARTMWSVHIGTSEKLALREGPIGGRVRLGVDITQARSVHKEWIVLSCFVRK